jgi:hypothetical protein
MGYQRTLLIEIPIPDPNQHPEFAVAVEALSQAQAHMGFAHDRDAVGSCRDALEAVTLAVGDNDNLDADVQRVLFANSRSMSKAERLRVLRRALKLVTHPARHRDEVSVTIDWSRIDAITLITMTAAFLREMDAPDARPSIPVPSEPAAQPEQPGG